MSERPMRADDLQRQFGSLLPCVFVCAVGPTVTTAFDPK